MHAVIFRSTRTLEDTQLYSEWSARMEEAVRQVEGYVSHFGFRDSGTGQGVTISYFADENAIRAWREFPEHLEAQALGREHFYDDFTLEVAHIERSYSWTRAGGYNAS